MAAVTTGMVPSTIHVISGTDWAPIWAAVATAVAAVVGVGGTAWQGAIARKAASADVQTALDASAKNVERNLAASAEELRQSLAASAANLVASMNAEDKRAEVAAKRRIYAACLASLKVMIPAVINHRSDMIRATTPQQRIAARSRMHESRLQMLNAVSEMRLIAPAEVAAPASKAERDLMTYINDTNEGAPLRSEPPIDPVLIDQLTQLMRGDLARRDRDVDRA